MAPATCFLGSLWAPHSALWMRALSPSRQTFQLPAGGHPFLSCMLVHAASGHGSSTASPELLNPARTCPSCSCSPAGMGLEARCCWRPRLDPVCGNKPRTTTVHSAWGSGEPELKNFLLCLRCIKLGRWLSPAGILHAPPGVIPSSRPPAKVQEGGENSQIHLYSCCPTSPGGKTVPHLPQALWLLPHCLPSPAQLSPQPASSHGAADGQRRKKRRKPTWLGVPTGFQLLTLLGMKFHVKGKGKIKNQVQNLISACIFRWAFMRRSDTFRGRLYSKSN